jgi:hypothetical protein
VKYDYAGCGSADWKFYAANEQNMAESRKKIETFLKTIPVDGVADPQTGEMMFPTVKTSSTTVTIEIL